MRECTNCKAAVPDGAMLCPNCGAGVPPLPAVGAAPPATERLMTNLAWLDITLGLLTVLAATMLFVIGFLLAVIVYFATRGSYPVYARGVGIGMALIGVLLLGAFGVCVYGLASSGGIH